MFGGPSQPEPEDERGGIKAAERRAMEDEKTINPNQYENDDVGLPEDPDGGGGVLTLVELEIAHSVDGPANTQAAPGDQRAMRRHGNLGYAPPDLL
ncbi:hypothetical protein IMZ48_12685 [Candidatus Bathyarchaeota archaeon]|nr:hypothetical protein [Candidatus Bathyarchaeota archaeon]